MTDKNAFGDRAKGLEDEHFRKQEAELIAKMRERAEYEQQVKEEDAMDSAEETLEVFEDEDVSMDVADDAPLKGKGKEVAAPADENLPAARKRRRPAVDVFTGTDYPRSSQSHIYKPLHRPQ